MFCKYCGSKLEEGTKFCPTCGASVTENTDAPATTNSGTYTSGNVTPTQQTQIQNTPAKSESNVFAVAGFILSLLSLFITPLLGLIFGIIGLNKSKTLENNNGRGLSIAAIIISAISIALIIFITIIEIIITLSEGTPTYYYTY